MKVVFVGGGAHRYLPVARSILANAGDMAGGELVLYDLSARRARAMADMIAKTPEFRAAPCKLTHDATLDAALDGADVVNVVLMAGSPLNFERTRHVCHRHGFIGSDQLSPSGAMLALKGGPILMDLARRMERRCPGAWLVDFANPVAVLSAAVNNHTTVRCLGVCAGYQNCLWDISRLLGRDERCEEAKIHCAGVNHMSYILRGSTWRGEDLYAQLDAMLARGPWSPPTFSNRWSAQAIANMEKGLRDLLKLYRRYGYLVFSTEMDGMATMDIAGHYKPRAAELAKRSVAEIETSLARSRQAREAEETHFAELLAADLDEAAWDQPDVRHPYLLRDDQDLMAMIVRARGGQEMRLAASVPNRGAVADLPDRVVVEYSQFLDNDGSRAAGQYAIPPVFYGWIASMAMHQTLLGDAIATGDPRLLFDAISCYPVDRDTSHFWQMWREVLDVAAEEIPASLRSVVQHLP